MTMSPDFSPTLYQNPNIGDYLRMLERRIARLERTTNGLDSDPLPTFITSLNITGLALASQQVAQDVDGYKVYLRFTWNTVSSDPNAINKDEVDYYLISHTTDGTNYTGEQVTRTTDAVVGPYAQNMSVTFRVRAHTKKGVVGNYTSLTVSTTADNVAPSQPSTPVVSPYLGQLMISWDGLNSSAGAMPADFKFTEVHLSTTGSTFTPSATTLVGTLLKGGGDWIATDLTYGTTYYARLVAVDTVGNRSSSSVAGSAIPEQIVNADVGANAIATANIQNLAVNNAKIADLSVGKLTAGTMTVNMTVSGRIATALTGARVEINSSGLQAFNASSVQTVDVSASTGDVTITGKFKTALSGVRVEMTDATDRSTVAFYAPTGTNFAFINTPTDGSGNPTLGMNSGEFTYNTALSRHRLWLDTDTGIFLQTVRSSGFTKNGFGLWLGPTDMSITYGGSGGTVSGAGLYMSNSQAELSQVTSSSYRGGRYFIDDTSLWYQVYAASANINVEVEHQDSGTINMHRGRYPNNVDLGQEQAVFTGRISIPAGNAWVISYGTARVATPATVVAPQFNAADEWAVVAASSSQFTVNSVNTVAGFINCWCYRMG
jgi:hypothetical protein